MLLHETSAFIITGLVCSVVLFQYCSKDKATDEASVAAPQLPVTPFNYNPTYPAHINAALVTQDNTPASNPITNDGATLGRVLFYDTQLSQNKSISCGSCHKSGAGFSDEAVLSRGFANGLTRRHSMSALNLRFYRNGKMFWDERAATLEEQVLMPIQDPTEMGLTLTELESRIATTSYYPALFQKAFGSSQVTSDRISKALAQFLRSMVTYQSKYDRVRQGLETFTPQEQAGEQIFLTGGPAACGGCHRPPMFVTSEPAAPFGLLDPTDAGINNQNRFKSGTLRNIAVSGPLFHNGSVPSLEAMLASNIPAHGVRPPDRAPILAFLQTLTDNSVATDPRFADPFK